MSDKQQLNEMKRIMAITEGANDNWGVGDFVVVVWDEAGRHGEPLKVVGVRGDQVKVVDDHGNSELMFPEDLRLAPNPPIDENESEWREEDEEEDEWAERFDMKYAEKEKFKGKTIVVTDLYDGDVYGIFNKKRFMISSPLDRGWGVGEVSDSEIEVADLDFSLSPKEEQFLRAWHRSVIDESVNEDENDARGKMCPVCSGGRREGYGSDCPNCNGEGYLKEEGWRHERERLKADNRKPLFEPIKYRYVIQDTLGNKYYVGVTYNDTIVAPRIRIWNDSRMQVSPGYIADIQGGDQEVSDTFKKAITDVIVDENFEVRPEVTSADVFTALRKVIYNNFDIRDFTGKMDSMTLDEDDDPDGMGSYDILWNDESWKEAIPYDKAEKEVERILQIIDDSALQAHDDNDHLEVIVTSDGPNKKWTITDPIDGDRQEVSIEPSDMPAGYTGESIVLDDIVENVLQEYPGQPKDYDAEDDFPDDYAGEMEDRATSGPDFEDEIDPEYEDSELGYRFD